MKKSLYFALSFCFVLILASCEKEQDFTSQQPAEKTRVFFNSTKDFMIPIKHYPKWIVMNKLNG